jgi:hypothetical protein
MAFELIHNGKKLSQEQLNAIVPVLNQNMQKPMSKKKFADACEKAMRDAGVPLQQEP